MIITFFRNNSNQSYQYNQQHGFYGNNQSGSYSNLNGSSVYNNNNNSNNSGGGGGMSYNRRSLSSKPPYHTRRVVNGRFSNTTTAHHHVKPVNSPSADNLSAVDNSANNKPWTYNEDDFPPVHNSRGIVKIKALMNRKNCKIVFCGPFQFFQNFEIFVC